MSEKKSSNLDVYNSMPVPQAVMKNALPAIAAMLMTLIYNLADTFFIGQTGDALQVAAVSLATPVFLIFTAVGSAFGIGGTSVISRSLGEGKPEYAKKVCSFCMWGSVFAGIILSVLLLLCMNPVLNIIGASEATWDFAKTYMTIVCFAGPFSLIANCFSNVVRAEGEANRAMMGQLIGNLLNMCLDAVLIIGLHWDIVGCALATVAGETFAAVYYIVFYLRGKSSLSIHIKLFTFKEKVATSTLAIGIPASLASLLMSLSQIIINSMMSGYDDYAVAGMGVAMKVVMITGMVCMGLGQGIQPLLGYCVGAKNMDRFQKIMKFSLTIAFVLGAGLAILCYIFDAQIVSAFLSEPNSYDYAVSFSKILLSTSWLFGIFYVLTNALQAMGAATPSLIINLSRQGIIYIPALFILNFIFGIYGLAWAQPVADVLSIGMAITLYNVNVRKMKKQLSPA